MVISIILLLNNSFLRMRLSVIIVNYNVKYFLEQCLCSVKKAIEKTDAEVFVVDNFSTDGSADYLKKNFSWVKLIVNNKNEGFAKANNIALKQCIGDHILFLNPDTIIPENILEQCLNFFDKHDQAGAIGVKMVDGAGNFLPESKRSLPAPMVSFFKLSGLSALFPQSKFFNRYALGFLDENELHEVEVLCGAFMMVKKNVVLQIGGFDEAFFMYGEDIDLCYRIKKEGNKIYYLGDQTIVHFKGESAKKSSFNYVRIFYQAMKVFVKKHYSTGNAWMIKVLLNTGIYMRAFVSLIASPFKHPEKNRREETTKTNFLLVGDPLSAAEAANVIKQRMPEATIKKLQSLHSLTMEPAEFSEIVFCTGRLSYKESIQLIVNERNNFNYKWHGLHTKSIVGSKHKEFTGEIYYLEEEV
jgi:N-acetylglucosaminyl-diphospho-decaprenol L-rhamnosyltransferase